MWSQIERASLPDYLATLTPFKTADWDCNRAYAAVRIRQAVEFRRSAASGTLVTAPLTLYYSFLNLLRGFMALVPEIRSTPGHGLALVEAPDLLSTAARLQRAGTFREYLTAVGATSTLQKPITLSDCLSYIPELLSGGPTTESRNVYPARIEAKSNGDTRVHLSVPEDEVE
ncbi:YaaC family protein [Rubidibacter lacunae]|uniref:YaaC family protein n=1 Tax=Rubidibacter lacunae TaxID=582514 RepID=UPI0012EC1FBB|nr:hypothetical protein [Rubidibacter lacunae]